VDFDDESLVANAGLILTATMAARLDLEVLIDSTLHLVGRVGGFRPGRKVMTLVRSIIAGGSHIDHADVLRAGARPNRPSHGRRSHRIRRPTNNIRRARRAPGRRRPDSHNQPHHLAHTCQRLGCS
jgi:hypothetical protein